MEAQRLISMTGSPAQASVDLTMPRLLALHLLPGVVATLVYLLLAPALVPLGFPPLLGLYLGVPLVIGTWELGFLLYQGRRRNDTFSLRNVVLYREPLSRKAALGFGLLFVAWAILTSGLFLVDNWVAATFFSWLPDWFRLADLPHYATLYSRSALLLTGAVGLLLNGLAGPIIEELYFRGYLLPRMRHLGRLAPLLNIVLFSLYHLWAPWQLVSRTVPLAALGLFCAVEA